MPNSKIQTPMGFAAGHQTPQRPDRKSRTVITKLLSYINVECTTMILCFIQTYVLLQDLSKYSVTVSFEREDLEIKRTEIFIQMQENLDFCFLEVKLYCKD